MTIQSQKTLSAQAWIELALLALIWGSVFLANAIALQDLAPLTLVAHRVFWAALILWSIVLSRRLPVPRSAKVWAAFVIMGLLNNVIPFALLNWAQLTIESGLTSIFNAATAIFGVLVAGLFFADEKLTTRKLLGVFIGFGGVVIAMGLDNLTRFDLRSLAQLAALGATLSYALAGAWARRALRGLSPIVASAGMLTTASVMTLPLAWWFDGPFELSLSATSFGAIAFVAIIATAGAYLLYFRVLEAAGSGNLLLVTLLIPPVAILLGALVLGEALQARAFVGFACLALGLLIIDGRTLPYLRNRLALRF